jgi:hypothetical protein
MGKSTIQIEPERDAQRAGVRKHRKYRPGFEPDKSSKGWMGLAVKWLPDSGFIDGLTGIVVAEEVRPVEFGWMLVRPDGPMGKKYPDGILVHTTEVRRLRRAEIARMRKETP